MSTFQAWYDIDLKSKVVSLNGLTLEISSHLNPIWHRGHLTLFLPLLAIWQSTFQVLYDIDLKSKVICVNGTTLEMLSDLNHISHGGYLTLF